MARTVSDDRPSVRLEPADTEDVDELVDAWVSLASDQRQHGSRIVPEASRETIRESIAQHVFGERLFVARTNRDGIIGFVMFDLVDGRFEEDAVRGNVSNLYVTPGYRNRGIGSELLDIAESELRDRGAIVVSLEVLAENADARWFYEQSGYETHRIELEKRFETDKDGR